MGNKVRQLLADPGAWIQDFHGWFWEIPGNFLSFGWL